MIMWNWNLYGHVLALAFIALNVLIGLIIKDAWDEKEENRQDKTYNPKPKGKKPPDRPPPPPPPPKIRMDKPDE